MLSSFEGAILLRSSVAQWWSNRLLTGRLAVRVRPEEPYITNKPSVPDRQGVVFVKGRVSEWPKEHDWKSCIRIPPYRGFKSHPVRHKWRVTQEAEGDGLLNR
jgi:hypothetical protein